MNLIIALKRHLKQGKLTAQVLLETRNQDQYLNVCAYGDILQAIVGGKPATCEPL